MNGCGSLQKIFIFCSRGEDVHIFSVNSYGGCVMQGRMLECLKTRIFVTSSPVYLNLYKFYRCTEE